MRKIRILVVDDEPGMLEVCEDTLSDLPNVEIETEPDSRKAAEKLARNGFDLLLSDVRMPGIDGIELLRIAREKDPLMPVLILTAYPSVETAVEAMKLGAADYIIKPFNTDDLLATVRRLIEEQQLRDENQLLRRQIERSYAFGEMLGRSSAMQKIFQTVERVAETDVDVLVLGETGTGKELIARSIHQRSARADKKFVPVDCGAIPKELMESEFFGHEKGAFTGAQNRNLGLLEYANQGTVFLDEIGHLSPGLQAKLLRALQERTIRRLGSNRLIDVDVRVIAATSLDLDAEVKAGRFRLDLYYRINVARVDLPPLREREGDIPLLAENMLATFASEMGRQGTELSPESLEVLAAYSWPGNVRELQNVLKRTLAMVRHPTIVPDDLPDHVVGAARHLPSPGEDGFFAQRERRVATFERDYLTNLLAATGGDVSRAARDAHLPRGTLYRLLKNHDLDPADFRER
jgi:DNA-binding NtrC family response regulator